MLQITKKTAQILLSGSFSDEDVKRAQAQLKVDIASSMETDDGVLEEIGLQSLHNGKVSSLKDVNTVIDSITASDMKGVSGRIFYYFA